MSKIDITGLDLKMVICAIYNFAAPKLMGFLNYQSEELTIKEAENLIENDHGWVDKYKGRIIGVRIKEGLLEVNEFECHYGQGVAKKLIDELQKSNSPNTDQIKSWHKENLLKFAQQAKQKLSYDHEIDESHQGILIVNMNMSDMADVVGPAIEKALQSQL